MPSILLNRSTLWGRWLFVKILTKMNDCAISHEIPWKRNIFLLQYWLLCMDVWIISKCCDKNFHKFSHTWFVYAALKFSWVSNLSHNDLLVIWFGGIFFFLEKHVTTRIHFHKFQTRVFAYVGSAVFPFYHKHFGHNRWIGVNHSNTCTDAYTNKGWIKIYG